MKQQLKVMEDGGTASADEMGRGCRERKLKVDTDDEVSNVMPVCTAK